MPTIKLRYLFLTTLLLCSMLCRTAKAGDVPDTVTSGLYITSIHNIDFKEKEYTITFWLWLKYHNKDFDFLNNLEIPQAKTVTRSFATIDSSNNQFYVLMKIQCVMKDSWRIDNFPFDKQKLRLSFENSQFDAASLVFRPDTFGKHFDPRFTLRGWYVDSLKIVNGIRVYETNFGDDEIKVPHTEYSNLKLSIVIDRDAMGLFWKMFLGMYVAFLIAFMCFFIHYDSIDSRFGLSVGALFAVVGNKYIIDSALPESSSFTLVDMLHGITLFFILAVIACNAWTLRLVTREKIDNAHRFDKLMGIVLFVVYAVTNLYFIWDAIKTTA